MTKEEKIKVIKDNWPYGRYQLSEALMTLIPDIQESEDENKVMEGKLREILRLCYEEGKCSLCASDYKKLLTWLEKQSENNMGISEATKKS